jgi:hypothetical protein
MIKENLRKFIDQEKEVFKSLQIQNSWEDSTWNVNDWLPNRSHEKIFRFINFSVRTKKIPSDVELPPKGNLPSEYSDFVKALVIYLVRTKGCGYIAARNYIIECRRLFIVMFQRKENNVIQLTRWHFEETITFLKLIQYKNIFDAATNLQIIADVIDKKNLSSKKILFKHGFKSGNIYYKYNSKKNIDFNEPEGNEKLPSFESLAAYAECSNNPIDDNEEILLRTIDLLIVTGQRVNEITHIPYDCWVEKAVVDSIGRKEKDANGNYIINYGIRYYAEKKFKTRVHWLANQDIPMAKRAIERLKKLTIEVREVAKWQENNIGEVLNYKNEKNEISEIDLIKYLSFNYIFYLRGYLKNKGLLPIRKDIENRTRISSNRMGYPQIYKLDDIKNTLLKELPSHNILQENRNNSIKTILKTSEILSIRFEGAFRFRRKSNILKIYPGIVKFKEINEALGNIRGIESIFERRKLTEADGTKIKFTSHQPRHWRNTIYELSGMSNVQQALALGRQNLTQNKAYQHTSIKEKLSLHQDFLSFNSLNDKVLFLKKGIREQTIFGEITDTYHLIKQEEGLESAEGFLGTHGLAIHLTPFGGCTHDFSQSPCQKHLQCWNGCSHLHRTNTPGETERIEEQLDSSKKVLKKILQESETDEDQSIWENDLKLKISNLEKALIINPSSTPVQLFPEGEEMTKSINKRRNKSV